MIPLSAENCKADNAISTEATPFSAPPLFFIAAAFATPAKPAPNKELIFNMLRCLQAKRRNKTEFLCRICLSLLRNKSGKMEDKYIQQFEEIVIRLEKAALDALASTPPADPYYENGMPVTDTIFFVVPIVFQAD